MASPNIDWPSPPAELPAGADDIHLWAVELDRPGEEIAALERLLSGEERERANQFKLPHLRERYTVARTALRRILAGRLGCDPAALKFDYTPRGKPFLAGAMAGQLHFNLAHSAELALIAVTTLAPLGVDVERIRPMRDALSIAERFFSPRELAALRGVPTAARDAAFFSLWSRKEAWLKATGDGIGDSLAKIEVAFLPAVEPRVLAIAGDTAVAAEWTLRPLHPAAGFVGALAIQRRSVSVQCWHFIAEAGHGNCTTR